MGRLHLQILLIVKTDIHKKLPCVNLKCKVIEKIAWDSSRQTLPQLYNALKEKIYRFLRKNLQIFRRKELTLDLLRLFRYDSSDNRMLAERVFYCS